VSSARFVVVNGPPGSGKTTISGELARRLGLPLFAKDLIKESLADHLGVTDVDASRQLGRTAIRLIYDLARQSQGAVLEGPFIRSFAVDELAALGGDLVEVFLRCPPDELRRRYRSRVRHACHFDGIRSDDELWNADTLEPVAGGWPVIEVDSSVPVDVGALVLAIAGGSVEPEPLVDRAALGGGLQHDDITR
jgi:predicted kinase